MSLNTARLMFEVLQCVMIRLHIYAGRNITVVGREGKDTTFSLVVTGFGCPRVLYTKDECIATLGSLVEDGKELRQ